MVKVIIIARKTDGLILCENSGDSVDNPSLMSISQKSKEMMTTLLNKSGDHSLNIDSQDYSIHFKIVENIVYLVITEKKYSQKLAFCLLEDLNSQFIEEMKSMFGSTVDYYSKVETINKEYFFYKFEKVLRRKKDEYENQNSRDNLEKIKREILDVQQIMNENINLLIDRESLFNSVSSMSSTMKDDSHKLYDRARKTRYSLLLRKYAVLIAIIAMVLLFVLFKYVL